MAPTLHPGQLAFGRRTLLAASAAGVAFLAVGCTSPPPAAPRERVTSAQADQLAAQVRVQDELVAAVSAATAADPTLTAEIPDLIAQAHEQLTRLRAAAPSATSSATATATASPEVPSDGDVRAWLRDQVTAAAASHAAAAAGQSGARAALLGSLSAGLRGHQTQLA